MNTECRTKETIKLPKIEDLSIPQFRYPWPELNSPFASQMEEEVSRWLDSDYNFLPKHALEKYKGQALHDVATRMSPNAKTIDFVRPCVRYVVMAIIFDDYYEGYTYDGLEDVRKRVYEVFMGDVPTLMDNGFFYQIAQLRREALAVLPERFITWLADGHDRFIRYGMMEEIQYKISKNIPPLKAYEFIREYSVGMHACVYMVDLGVGYSLSEEANFHPALIRLRALLSRIFAWQNDLNSLPKEIFKSNEVCNIVFVLQREYNISFMEALSKAIEIHDNDLMEYLSICESLREYSIYNEELEIYIHNMGLMISGCNSWYRDITKRYLPSAYTGMLVIK